MDERPREIAAFFLSIETARGRGFSPPDLPPPQKKTALSRKRAVGASGLRGSYRSVPQSGSFGSLHFVSPTFFGLGGAATTFGSALGRTAWVGVLEERIAAS